jgi:hypothetical protein
MNDDNNAVTESEPETIEYKYPNMTFIVEPVYRENAEETIGSILLRLMQKDVENTEL